MIGTTRHRGTAQCGRTVIAPLWTSSAAAGIWHLQAAICTATGAALCAQVPFLRIPARYLLRVSQRNRSVAITHFVSPLAPSEWSM
jgi:hypothetical protein